MRQPRPNKTRTEDKKRGHPPSLTIKKILRWADAYHARTGYWPGSTTPHPVPGAPQESWQKINAALSIGARGLPGGTTLVRLLAKHRKRVPWQRQNRPRLTEAQIVRWAKEYHARTGAWPDNNTKDPIPGAPGESWSRIQCALSYGSRGFPGGSSLVRLLAKHGKRVPWQRQNRPRLTKAQIIRWSKEYRARTGRWPDRSTKGPIPGAPGESWSRIQCALSYGSRGFPGGSSLVRLLAKHGKKRCDRVRKCYPLTEEQIFKWAKAHHKRTGRWPGPKSGWVVGTKSEKWGNIDMALRNASRGLPGGSTLIKFLEKSLGVRKLSLGKLPLTRKQVLAWAKAHYKRTGRWPNMNSGPIPEAPGESWNKVCVALSQGLRGFPGGTTLFQLTPRSIRKRLLPGSKRSRLTIRQILGWADAYHAQTGRWPAAHTKAPVPGQADESWLGIHSALERGRRGLPGGSSLAKLLVKHGRKPHVGYWQRRPPLTEAQIFRWAKAYRQRTGRWPVATSGPVPEAPDETWSRIDNALRQGFGGLPGRSSLSQFIKNRTFRRARRHVTG